MGYDSWVVAYHEIGKPSPEIDVFELSNEGLEGLMKDVLEVPVDDEDGEWTTVPIKQ